MVVTFEKFKSSEADEVHFLWSDEAATLYTNFPYLPTLEECRQRLVKMMAYYSQRIDYFGPSVIRSDNGTFLGLTGGDAGATPGEYEIWYFIRRDMRGKKIATSAVALLLDVMKLSGRVKSIKAEVAVDNEPSWRFLEKLGFRRTNTIPDGHKKNGKAWDRYVYTLSAS